MPGPVPGWRPGFNLYPDSGARRRGRGLPSNIPAVMARMANPGYRINILTRPAIHATTYNQLTP